MENLTREQKLKFLKSQNIPVLEHGTNIDEIYNLALVKELCGSDCFGANDPTNEICKSCYFNEDVNSPCKKLTEHISKITNNSYQNTEVRITNINGKEFKMDSIESILSRLTVKEATNEFKMAKLIVEKAAQNKPFNEVLSGIGAIKESDDVKKQQIYFYKVRKRLKDEAKISIEIVVYKYVSLMGDSK